MAEPRNLIRIASTDIDTKHHVLIGLSKIRGINIMLSNAICRVLKMPTDKKISELDDKDIETIEKVSKDYEKTMKSIQKDIDGIVKNIWDAEEDKIDAIGDATGEGFRMIGGIYTAKQRRSGTRGSDITRAGRNVERAGKDIGDATIEMSRIEYLEDRLDTMQTARDDLQATYLKGMDDGKLTIKEKASIDFYTRTYG